MPIVSPYPARASTCSGRGAGEQAAEPRRRGDQRAGLLGDDVQVVLDRVAAARPDRLGDLAVHQPGERPRLQPHRLGPERSGDVRRPREQIVADQDRDRVGPAGVRAGRAAPHGRPRPSRRRGRAWPDGSAPRPGRPARSRPRVGSPNCAPSARSSGRNRLPPASIRCRAASATSGSALATLLRSASSTAASVADTDASTAGSMSRPSDVSALSPVLTTLSRCHTPLTPAGPGVTPARSKTTRRYGSGKVPFAPAPTRVPTHPDQAATGRVAAPARHAEPPEG